MLTLSAAAAGGAALVGWVLRRGAQGEGDEAVALLISAARDGRLYELTELVERSGVSVEAQTEDGMTALYAAAAAGHIAAVRLLLSLGANPLATIAGGRIALHAAAAHGKVPSLQAICEQNIFSVTIRDDDGAQPLHAACVHGQLAAAEALLALNSPVNACTKANATPLMLAAASSSFDPESAAACVRVLLEQGADVALTDVAGESALHFAVRNAASTSDERALEVVSLLCEKGAPLFRENQDGIAPIDLAVGLARGLLDQTFATRLRGGHAEAISANAARSRLVARVRMLASDDPMTLQSLWRDVETKRLFRRFGIRPPPELAAGLTSFIMDETGAVGGLAAGAFEEHPALQSPVAAPQPPRQPQRPGMPSSPAAGAGHHAVGEGGTAARPPTPPTARVTSQLRSMLEVMAGTPIGERRG